MYSRWVGTVICSLAAFRVAMAAPKENHTKPVGIKMCKNLCSHRVGCLWYLYASFDLSCYLISNNATPKNDVSGTYLFKLKDKERIFAEGNLPCKKGSKIYHTKRNTFQCSQINIRRRPHQSQSQKPEKQTRLLLLPYTLTGKPSVAQQVFLPSRSVAPYPYIYTGKTWAVAYIVASKKLLLSMGKSFFLCPLDSDKKFVILEDIVIYGIGVDETRKLVFITSVPPDKSLRKMTTDCEILEVMFKFEDFPMKLVAHCKRSRVYIQSSDKIMKFTYQGDMKVLVKGKFGNMLCLDPLGDVIFYHDMSKLRSTIIKMSLSDFSTQRFRMMDTRYFSGHFTGNTLYVFPRPFKGRFSIFTRDGNVDSIDVKYQSKVITPLVCVIPPT